MRRRLLIYTMTVGMALGALSGCADTNKDTETTVATEATAEAAGTAETAVVETNEVPVAQATGNKEVGPGVPKPLENVMLWGQVKTVDKEYNRITFDNRSQGFPEGEIIFSISQEKTKVLDAVEGLPVSLDDIKEGDTIYAYTMPVMTLSLPPIATPTMILCKIPADFRVPSYVTVDSMAKQEDGSYKLTASDDTEYAVPADCSISPYLTRNMVYLDNVTKGNHCLLWMNAENQVYKIVLFAD